MTTRDKILAALVSVIWGLGFVAIKFGLESFSPAQLGALRFILAALPVFILPRPAMAWPMLIAIGLSLFTVQFLLFFFAYAAGVPPGVVAVTIQMQVFFTVLLAAAFLRDRPSAQQAAGMLIAFGGLAAVGLTVGGDLSALGLGLVVGSALSWAIGNVLVKRAGEVEMLPLVSWLSLVPPIPALVVSSFDPHALPIFSAIATASWLSIGALIYLAVFATSIAYALWGYLLARYPTAAVAPFALLSPCTGFIASALAFGERFSAVRDAGMALILLGLAVVLLPARPRSG
jgi:O-acetylserine/cysteine efflux transporter